MNGLSEFLHMGGYAVWVWSSYGICFVVLVINFLVPMVRRKRLRQSLARQARFEQAKQ